MSTPFLEIYKWQKMNLPKGYMRRKMHIVSWKSTSGISEFLLYAHSLKIMKHVRVYDVSRLEVDSKLIKFLQHQNESS